MPTILWLGLPAWVDSSSSIATTVQRIVKKQLVQVSMSSDEDGVKQVFQVQKRIVRGGIARQQRYNLYFIDSKLIKYEKESETFSF